MTSGLSFSFDPDRAPGLLQAYRQKTEEGADWFRPDARPSGTPPAAATEGGHSGQMQAAQLGY